MTNIDIFRYPLPADLDAAQLRRLSPALQVKTFCAILVSMLTGAPTPEPSQIATDITFVRRIVLESITDNDALNLTKDVITEIRPVALAEEILVRMAFLLKEAMLDTGFGTSTLSLSRFARAIRTLQSSMEPPKAARPPPISGLTSIPKAKGK